MAFVGYDRADLGVGQGSDNVIGDVGRRLSQAGNEGNAGPGNQADRAATDPAWPVRSAMSSSGSWSQKGSG
jgi:hypothetical protein